MFRSFLIGGFLVALIGFLATRYNTPSYSIVLAGHDSTWVGNYAHLRLSIVPEDGWKVSKEAPTKITLNHSENVIINKDFLTLKDATWDKDGTVHFDLIVTGKKQGISSIEADVTFFICNPSTCKRASMIVTRSITVNP